MIADLVYAIRSFRRAPGFTLAATLTFALGLGANIAIFSAVDRMLFRPLPYGDAGDLIHVHMFRQSSGEAPEAYLPAIVTAALRAGTRSLDGVAYASGGRPPLTIDGFGPAARFDEASYNLLQVLRVTPHAGRDFTLDDVRARERLVLLTYEAWRTRFGASSEIFSRTFGTGRRPYRIAGVLPSGFLVPSSAPGDRVDGLLLNLESPDAVPGAFELGPSIVARLRQGYSVEQARAEVDTLVQRIAQDEPRAGLLRRPVTVQPLRSGLFVLHRPFVWLIVAAGAAVLLIACVNLATLLLARGRSREQDTAVRSAIGASTTRLIRVAFVEAALLCLLGTTVAVLACAGSVQAMLPFAPASLRGTSVSPLDLRIVALTVLAACASTILAGVMPALRLGRTDLLPILQRGGGAAGSTRLRGGAALLALQSAVAVVLVSGAIMTVWSFLGLVLRNPGHDTTDLYRANVNHGSPWRDDDRGPRVRAILDSLQTVPGLAAAAVVSGAVIGDRFVEPGFWQSRGERGGQWGVSADVFEALRTPVLHGRPFTPGEVDRRALVAVLNETGARQLWPGEPPASAIGRQIETSNGRRDVIGVVQDIRRRPGESVLAGLYLPMTAREVRTSQSAAIVLFRMDTGHAPDHALIQRRLDERLGRNRISVAPVQTTGDPWLQRPRFQAMVFGSLALIALLLTVVGLYALAALELAERRFEFGVRLSLGATASHIRRSVLRTSVVPVVVGATGGLAIAWWASRFLQAFLFELDGHDPRVFVLVAVIVAVASCAAAWLPARRAARLDPVAVLRGL